MDTWISTWKTLGALTRDARADDRVAEKMPAVMRGPKPDTILITCRKKRREKNSQACIWIHFLITDLFN